MIWLLANAIYIVALLCIWAFIRGADERRDA
jgi:hypothetical protein